MKDELRLKIEKLKNKWLVEPEKYTRQYWHYRADMCLIIKYEVKLKKFGDFEKNIITPELFS